MPKKTETTSENRDTSPEAIREWGLRLLIEAGEAALNLAECGKAECGKAEYLKNLSSAQSNKIKRVVYGKSGNVVSMEPVALVDIIRAAADIAGTKEAAKEKSKAGNKRSNKLSLEIVGGKNTSAPEAKNKKSSVTDILKGIKGS